MIAERTGSKFRSVTRPEVNSCPLLGTAFRWICVNLLLPDAASELDSIKQPEIA